MPTIDHHAASANWSHLIDTIEDMDARLGGAYHPALDDLQREAAELHWQVCHS